MTKTKTKTITKTVKALDLEPGDKITHEGGVPLIVKSVQKYHDHADVPSPDHIGLDIEGFGVLYAHRSKRYKVTREEAVKTFAPGTLVLADNDTTLYRRTVTANEWRIAGRYNIADRSTFYSDEQINECIEDGSYGMRVLFDPEAK